MRFKHLIILGLVLMILTIGEVSASENITDDQLTVEDEAIIHGNSQEDELAEVQYVDGFGVEFQQSIALNSESELLWVNNYNHLDGNLKINIKFAKAWHSAKRALQAAEYFVYSRVQG